MRSNSTNWNQVNVPNNRKPPIRRCIKKNIFWGVSNNFLGGYLLNGRAVPQISQGEYWKNWHT